MNKVILFFAVVFITFFSIESCIHNPSDIIPEPIDTSGIDTTHPPTRPCSPDTVYYARDIQPLFNSYCVGSGCHNPPNPQEGLNVTSYSTVMASGKVKAYNGAGSKLYESLNASGEDQMPRPPASPLSDQQKALIKKWIDQGAKDLWCDDMTGPCDTTNVKYSTTINTILTTNCTGCHGTNGGVTLSNYSGVKTVIDNGKLWNAVNHLSGVQKSMPNSTTFLSKCNLRQIKIWIDAGAPNN